MINICQRFNVTRFGCLWIGAHFVIFENCNPVVYMCKFTKQRMLVQFCLKNKLKAYPGSEEPVDDSQPGRLLMKLRSLHSSMQWND